MHADITIRVEITDPAALHARAGSDYCIRNAGRPEAFDEAVEFLGDEAAPKLDQCLRQLYDVEHVNAGITVVDSHAAIVDAPSPETTPRLPLLRAIGAVTAATAMLTMEELERMNATFDYDDVEGSTHDKRACIDIEHDGLYISPKDYGFYVRVPSPDSMETVLPQLTPEMRAIVEAAAAQGAVRIEFDCDEDVAEGFPAFEHE